jgi:hypothetical protein
VRGSEPKGKLCATGSEFMIVFALSFSLSGKTACSLTGRMAVYLWSVHSHVASGMERSYWSKLHQQ